MALDLRSEELRERVREVIRNAAEAMGLELVDVEFVGRHRGGVVRITIDSEGGVTLADCGRVSREVGQRLDQEEDFDQAYTLEVSSPGVDRPFTEPKHYRRSLQRKIDVVLKEPLEKQTFLRGVLVEVDDEAGIVLRPEKGPDLPIRFDAIKRANRTVEF